MIFGGDRGSHLMSKRNASEAATHTVQQVHDVATSHEIAVTVPKIQKLVSEQIGKLDGLHDGSPISPCISCNEEIRKVGRASARRSRLWAPVLTAIESMQAL